MHVRMRDQVESSSRPEKKVDFGTNCLQMETFQRTLWVESRLRDSVHFALMT